MNDLFKFDSPDDLLEIRGEQLSPFKVRNYNEEESSFCNNYYEVISSNFVIRVGIIFGYGLSVGLIQKLLNELEEKGDKERTFYFLLHDFSSLISKSLATNIIEIKADIHEALIKVKSYLGNYQGFLFLFGIFGKEDSTSYLLSIFPKIFHDLGEVVINKPQLMRISVDIKDQIEKGGVNEKERN